MKRLSNEYGKVYGLLTVVADVMNYKTKTRMMFCRCACGNEKIIAMASLRSGATKSCGCMQKIGNVRQHILSKTIKNGDCIEWIGLKDKDGYGKIKINKKNLRVHRVIYEDKFGKIKNNFLVCHTCDNPSCVNINHLFLGTVKDNTQDMLEKGRGFVQKQFGENNNQAKLTKSKVIRILEYADIGIKQKEIASMFNISPVTVSNIIKNKSWKHIERRGNVYKSNI